MEMENKIKQIVQSFLRDLQALEEEKQKKLCEIPKDNLIEDLEIYDKYANLINDLHEKYAKELEKYVDEVTLEFVDDVNIKVGRKFTNTKVYVYYYNLPKECVVVHELPLISEETTPFTHKLIRHINWGRIRPVWAPNIHNLIITLAEAELRGNLHEALEEVEEKLRAGAWIYDYQHFQKALQKTKAEIIKQ